MRSQYYSLNRSSFKKIFIAFVIALSGQQTGIYAQQAVRDTSYHPFQPNPKRAGLFSAILPGLGQAYNRQYWKVPVIYAGLGAAGYFMVDNYNNYQSYRKAYVGRINNPYYTDQYTNIYTSAQLKQLQDDYNRFLDMTVLFTGVGYALQIVEAMTGAHLKNFDVSRDLSVNIRPSIQPNYVGIGLVLSVK